MSIIGFNFTKMLIEKKDIKNTGKVKVSNNVAIKNVNESGIKISSDDQISLKFDFEFVSKYEPELGSVKLEGNVITLEKKDDGQKIIDEWEKSKKIGSDSMKRILNTILAKANVQALILTRDVNLPSPIPLPKVNTK